MLKRFILAGILCSTAAFSIHAAEEPKAPAPQAQAGATKPNETSGKITLPEARLAEVPERNRKWSDPNLDLTHCLSRSHNTEIIKCVE